MAATFGWALGLADLKLVMAGGRQHLDCLGRKSIYTLTRVFRSVVNNKFNIF
jgi:hypothetical protein